MSESTQPTFHCGEDNRRNLVRNALGTDGRPPINAIDYLEVTSVDQTQLDVFFVHPLPGEVDGVPHASAPLGPDNVQIEGGERIRNLEVVGVESLGKRLRVTVDRAGDFSFYTLRLVTNADDSATPAGFDPHLGELSFSFKVACASDFDCASTPVCELGPRAVPRIDYLARDYATLRRVLLDRMRLLLPRWTEDTAADLPIALVELLAYVGDQLSYAQDAVATESYLDRSRHRISVRRHARLRDYYVHEGCNARTWVQFEVDSAGVVVPAGTRVVAGTTDQRALASRGEFDRLDPARSAVFETVEARPTHPDHNRLQVYTWGDTDCVLCAGACEATLVRPAQPLVVGEVLIFEELVDPRAPTLEGREDHRWAVRLSTVEEHVDPLDGTLLVTVGWDRADALPFPFVVSGRVDGLLVSDISVARGNVVLADFGLTLDEDAGARLEPDAAPSSGDRYEPVLSGVDLCFSEQPPTIGPAAQALAQDPRAALPQVWIRGGDEEWDAVRDLLASDENAAEFVVEMDETRRAYLRFGDGEHGRVPSAGTSFTAQFRIGNGAAGNVGADTLVTAVVPGGGVRRVRNPLPAVGGSDPEPLEEVKAFAPVAFRRQERAVTLDDWAEVAQRMPGVQQARATFRWLASWYTVVLAVDREGGLPLDEAFRARLLRHLERYRLAGYDLELREPLWVPLDLELVVCLEPGANRGAVHRELDSRLGSGANGLFHPDNFTFGRCLYSSRIIEAATRVPGVERAWLTKFQRFGHESAGELDDGYIRPEGNEILRLSADPSYPEQGRIAFDLRGDNA